MAKKAKILEALLLLQQGFNVLESSGVDTNKVLGIKITQGSKVHVVQDILTHAIQLGGTSDAVESAHEAALKQNRSSSRPTITSKKQ